MQILKDQTQINKKQPWWIRQQSLPSSKTFLEIQQQNEQLKGLGQLIGMDHDLMFGLDDVDLMQLNNFENVSRIVLQIESALSFIAQMCENHNITSQNLMRKQERDQELETNEAFDENDKISNIHSSLTSQSVNIVSAIIEYLDSILPPKVPLPYSSAILMTELSYRQSLAYPKLLPLLDFNPPSDQEQ
ncbi:MAG: hypothetical protein EZS28_048239, partial [Streblomastix strix]